MNLLDLPQFRVTDVSIAPAENAAWLTGSFCDLRGIHSERGWLYRGRTSSLIADLQTVPTSPGELVRISVFLDEFTPDIRPGAVLPWLDGYWQAYHLAMILQPPARWQRRTFVAKPARYFRLNGAVGWQPEDGALPEGAEDLGVRPGAWDHEHCELCRTHIGAAGEPEGYMDPDEFWLCPSCYEKYAAKNDVSFAVD
jgi:hypothetical protein